MDAVRKYKKRREKRIQSRMDAGEGRWVTTENDHHVHISGEGVPDKGNPHVLKAMSGGAKVPKKIEKEKKTKESKPDTLSGYSKAEPTTSDQDFEKEGYKKNTEGRWAKKEENKEYGYGTENNRSEDYDYGEKGGIDGFKSIFESSERGFLETGDGGAPWELEEKVAKSLDNMRKGTRIELGDGKLTYEKTDNGWKMALDTKKDPEDAFFKMTDVAHKGKEDDSLDIAKSIMGYYDNGSNVSISDGKGKKHTFTYESVRKEQDDNSSQTRGNKNKEYGYGSGSDRIETSAKKMFGRKGEADISKFSGMTKEERNKMLDDAPDGSRITGIVHKNGPYKGSEVRIEKGSGYGMSFTSVAGTKEKMYGSYWEINGAKDPYIKATIRQILDGSNEYYELKK